MMKSLHYKTIACMTVMFLTGLVTGSVWTSSNVRVQEDEIPCYSELSELLKQRLQLELSLTPDQLAKINPEICRACSELTNIHHQTVVAGWETLRECYRSIEGFLTEEQKNKLEACETKHQHRLLLRQEMIHSSE
ncbi:hypothetical protein OAM01_02220 [bacterium]|nr:hypothetical protein [bacterium]